MWRTNAWDKARPQHRELRAPTLFDKCVGSLTSPADYVTPDVTLEIRDGAYGL